MTSADEYLNTLTGGRNIQKLSDLPSAQRARFIGWARTNDVDISDFMAPATVVDQSRSIERVSRVKAPSPQSADLAVGVDMQRVSQLFPESVVDLKSDESLLQIFTMEELAYAEGHSDPLSRLTGFFAAKEAVIKASGATSISALSAISISHNNDGRPVIDGYEISITHSDDLAVAVAVSQQQRRTQSKALAELRDYEFSKPKRDLFARCMGLIAIILLGLDFGYRLIYSI